MYYILSQPNCSYCQKAKELITKNGFTYEETNIKSSPIVKALAVYAGFSTVPQIWVSTLSSAAYVGGYDDLVEHFEES